MMKIFTAIICLILVSPLTAQVSEDVRDKQSISKNHIKNQISWDYRYTGNKPESKGIRTSVTKYSASGEILQTDALNPAGAVTHTETYAYDSRGNKTEYARNSGDGSYQKKYVYNDRDQLIEESGFDGVENFKNQYFYNEQGDMTEIRYHKNSVITEKRIFSKDGVTTIVKVYNRTGTMISRLVLIYDSRGNLIEESVFGISPDPLEKKTYNYDEKRKLKEEVKFKLNKMTVRNSYNYTPSGALSEIFEESPGNGKFLKKSMEYNSDGNVAVIRWRRNGSEEFNSITYQYDDRGLCISAETIYPATKYKVLTKYEYEYY